MKKEATCRCDAYRFPHRAGGGRCTDESMWESVYAAFLPRYCSHEGCSFFYVTHEHHPYGSTAAKEELAGCMLEEPTLDASCINCPGVQAIKDNTYPWALHFQTCEAI